MFGSEIVEEIGHTLILVLVSVLVIGFCLGCLVYYVSEHLYIVFHLGWR